MAVFKLIFDPAEDQLPMPHAGVSVAPIGKSKTGELLITSSCASFQDIERQIRSLQKELDRTLDEAKRQFALRGSKG